VFYNRIPKIIFLVGVDGVGKTLYANMLLERLKARGFQTKHVWSRYNNYLSKPLLAFTYLIGYNYKETHNNMQFGYHDFFRSQIISSLFTMCQIVDVNIATYFKIRWYVSTNEVLVCDRGPYDTLVDVMLDTGRDLLNKKSTKSFLALLPRDHMVFYLTRPLSKIYEHRPELKYDRNLLAKKSLYYRCYEYFGWQKVDNIKPPNEVINEILTSLMLV